MVVGPFAPNQSVSAHNAAASQQHNTSLYSRAGLILYTFCGRPRERPTTHHSNRDTKKKRKAEETGRSRFRGDERRSQKRDKKKKSSDGRTRERLELVALASFDFLLLGVTVCALAQ